jgi:hypothetical protein
MKMSEMKLEAERLRTCWIVRPVGSLGTIGWAPAPWEAYPVPFGYAPTEKHAVAWATKKLRGVGR